MFLSRVHNLARIVEKFVLFIFPVQRKTTIGSKILDKFHSIDRSRFKTIYS